MGAFGLGLVDLLKHELAQLLRLASRGVLA